MDRPLLSLLCGVCQVLGLVLLVVERSHFGTHGYAVLILIFGIAPIVKLFDRHTREHLLGYPAAIAGMGTLLVYAPFFRFF